MEMKYLWKLAGISGIMFGLGSGSPVAAQGSIGCHLGAQAGQTIGSSSISDGTTSIDGLSARSRSPDFGLHTGCDYKIPTTAFSVGAWGEYVWRDVAFKTDAGPFGTFTAGLGNAWAIGARAGYVLSNGVMPYALIGYTQTDLTIPTGVDISSSLKGWMGGGGIEVPLAKNLSFAGEARWTKFDSVDLTTVGGGALKTDALSVVGRLNFNLN